VPKVTMSEQMLQPEGAPRQPSLVDDLLSRGRIYLMLGLFAVEVLIFVAGLFTPLGSETQQSIANQTNSQFDFVKTATAIQVVFFIFGHNLLIALIELVPILGAFFYLFSIYSTGVATQAIVGAQGLPTFTGLVLFFLPYTFVELSAYAIAVGSGTMLIASAAKHRFLRELKVFGVEIVLVAVVLLLAATMETITTYYVVVGLALWAPAGLLLAAAIVLAGRRKR